MGQTSVTFSVQFAHLVMLLVCAVCVLLPFATANLQNEVPTYEEFNKRDVGLEACQTHPRNCPGGYVLKRNRLIESLLNREAMVPVRQDERLRAQAILEAGEDLKRSLSTLRNGLRYKLIQLLRPSLVDSSDESKELL